MIWKINILLLLLLLTAGVGDGGMAAPGLLLQEAGRHAAAVLSLRQGAAGVRTGHQTLPVHAGGQALHPVHRLQAAHLRPLQGGGGLDCPPEQTP